MTRPYIIASVPLILSGCALQQDAVVVGPESAVQTESIHNVTEGAHCARCNTIWGTVDLEACAQHREAGASMNPYCKHCKHHGAYKFIFDSGLSPDERNTLRQRCKDGQDLASLSRDRNSFAP